MELLDVFKVIEVNVMWPEYSIRELVNWSEDCTKLLLKLDL